MPLKRIISKLDTSFYTIDYFSDFYLSGGDIKSSNHDCYIILLFALLNREVHILPDDDKWFCRLLEIDLYYWASFRIKVLIKHFRRNRFGEWYNERVFSDCIRHERFSRNKNEIRDTESSCSYCGTKNGPFEVDHVYPKSRGGTNRKSNLALACFPCNREKRDKTPWEYILFVNSRSQRGGY